MEGSGHDLFKGTILKSEDWTEENHEKLQSG
jgi:hypothetical protein